MGRGGLSDMGGHGPGKMEGKITLKWGTKGREKRDHRKTWNKLPINVFQVNRGDTLSNEHCYLGGAQHYMYMCVHLCLGMCIYNMYMHMESQAPRNLQPQAWYTPLQLSKPAWNRGSLTLLGEFEQNHLAFFSSERASPSSALSVHVSCLGTPTTHHS